MSVFVKRTVITLAAATALSALTSVPSLAGVITPTDKTTVSTASPVDSVYYGWCHRRHHYHWRTAWVYPYYYPYAGWGWGWGGGLFPFL